MAKKVAIVLTSGFADWEYALIAGVGGPFYGLDVAFFAPQAGTLRSQGGLTVDVAHGVAELADWRPEVLVVVGGTLWKPNGRRISARCSTSSINAARPWRAFAAGRWRWRGPAC